jgi:hypothetical protein
MGKCCRTGGQRHLEQDISGPFSLPGTRDSQPLTLRSAATTEVDSHHNHSPDSGSFTADTDLITQVGAIPLPKFDP